MKGWRVARKLMPKSKCAKGSFRIIDTSSGNTRIVICCPRGHWKKNKKRNGKRGSCEVGTRGYELLKRRKPRRFR